VVRGLITDPPSAWLAVPFGCSVAALGAGLFGHDQSLVPFALYVLAVTVVGTMAMRSPVVGENMGLSLLALVFGGLSLEFLVFAVQGARASRRGWPFLVIILAAAAALAVACGLCISGIVVFHRRMPRESTTNNEATTRHG
jgi:hypothetical protein